ALESLLWEKAASQAAIASTAAASSCAGTPRVIASRNRIMAAPFGGRLDRLLRILTETMRHPRQVANSGNRARRSEGFLLGDRERRAILAPPTLPVVAAGQ